MDNANEEIESLHQVNPAQTAVVDRRFAGVVKQTEGADTTATVVLTSYKPNELIYEVGSQKGGTVVFSEIYYPGWRSYVDGEEVAHGRANYILRAMNVPAGKHEVKFVFDPQSLHITEAIAFGALGLLLAGAVLLLVLWFKKQKA